MGSGTGGREVPNRSVRFIVNNESNVPNLAWGNWVKEPILLKAGYTNQVHMSGAGNGAYCQPPPSAL